MKLNARKLRLGILGASCMIATLTLWTRLVQVQVLRHNTYSAVAQNQREDPREVPATRGGIFDRNGRPLALSAQMHSVSVSPRRVKDRSYVEKTLASLLPVSRSSVRAALRSGKRFVWIVRQVSIDAETRTRLGDIAGVEVHSEPGRVYPYNGVAGKVVGFVGLGNVGRAGIEAAFNDVLSGTPGEAIYIRNGAYRSDRYHHITTREPVDGQHVYLTIDAALQGVTEHELRKALVDHKARSGVIIVMDVHTGEILALAEAPWVSDRSSNIRADSLWTLHSISHVYEPGSTFKVVTASALLEKGRVAPVDSFDAENGVAHLGFATIRDTHPHGIISFQQAFSLSSNIVMAKASQLLSPEEFYDYVRLFGFGEKTGIRLNGESAGRVPAVADWSLRTKSTMAFGQEIAVTPLQMLCAVAAIANDGKMMMPRIVRGIGDVAAGRIEKSKPVVVRKAVSRRTAQTLQEFCRSVVTEGTGQDADVGFMAVAGKTGTAQKASARGGYKTGKYVASFVGYAPQEDPRIAVLVLLDEPKWASRYGGDSAAPVFASLCKSLAGATDIFDGAIVAESIDDVPRKRHHDEAPNFLRMERGEALEYARSLKANVLCQGEEGRVVAQDPPPGVAMDGDGVIRLFVAAGRFAGRTQTPKLTGLSMRAAKRLAAREGLVARFVGNGTVRRQNPRPGAIASSGFVKLYCDQGVSTRAGGSR